MLLFVKINLLILWTLIPGVYCTVTNVTVLWNDARLIYDGLDQGVRVFGDPDNAGKGCVSGYQATSTAGSSVSLNFTGTALQYNFLADGSGSEAAIFLNGTQVDLVPTFQTGAVAYSTCSVVTKSITVDTGTHNVKIVNSPVNASLTVIYFQSMTYTPPDDGDAASANPKTSHSAVIGGVIAGVVGILIIIATIIYILRRQKKHHIVDLGGAESEGAANHDPENGVSGYDNHLTSATPFLLGANLVSAPPSLEVISPASPFFAPVNRLPLVTSPPSSSSQTRDEKAPAQSVNKDTTSAGKGVGASASSSSSAPAPNGLTPGFIHDLMQHNIPGPEIAALIRSVTAREEQEAAQASPSHAGTAQSELINLNSTIAPPAYDYKGSQ
ncbi:hypothetical protein FRB97_007310 [Tulasnella sp. 331]|nr:hypothetical protein FRB97_007310 [Tulasnella sp. 331]